MSQNLDLNITTSNITAASSDVTTNWTTSSTYPARATTTSLTTGSTSYTETYSWDLGQYVINAPTATTPCANNATGLASCTMFTDVTGWTASDDPNFYKNNSGSPVNAVTKTYDAHYLVGNYYQWNAATAGTGGTITSANATGSICPKGWKLPNSSSTFNETSGSFYYLLSQYGVQSSLQSTSSVNGNTYNIALSPLFGVRAGGVYSINTTAPFQSAGGSGYYWSSRADSSTYYTYRLNFYTSVNPSYGSARYLGYSLRCLIPTP